MKIAGLRILVLLILAFWMVSPFFAADNTSVFTPDSALSKLEDGNTRFRTGKRIYPHQSSERRKTTAMKGQNPFAVLIGCSDSRVPVEHIFDAGIGDIFTIRVAGNVATEAEIGSAEYGVGHLGAPLIVVLGHSSCGAVTAVVKGASVEGNLSPIIESIDRSVKKAKAVYGDAYSDRLLDESIKINVYQTMEDLLSGSALISDLVKSGRVKVVGAVFHLETGAIDWLGEHPMQAQILDHTYNSDSMMPAPSGEKSQETPGRQPSIQNNRPVPAASGQPAVSERPAPVLPAATQKNDLSIKFLFSKKTPLVLSPRKPLYTTIRITAPLTAEKAVLKVYAEKKGSDERYLVFSLPAIRIIDGIAQAQFYWAARKFRTESYIPQGRYVLYARLEAFDKSGAAIGEIYTAPLPKKQYIALVK